MAINREQMNSKRKMSTEDEDWVVLQDSVPGEEELSPTLRKLTETSRFEPRQPASFYRELHIFIRDTISYYYLNKLYNSF